MPNTHSNITDLFEDIADAIREQDETADPIVADTFPARIRAIPSGGGGTDGQFFPMNMAESVIPTITMKTVNEATMIDISGTNYINSGVFYTPGSGTNKVFYCDFGKTLTSAFILATKNASSNRFRFAFFNSDPSTFTTDTTGIGYYPTDSNDVTPAGTQQLMQLTSPYAARYMVVGVSNDNMSTPAPTVVWVEI